jgi:hypothetical protein
MVDTVAFPGDTLDICADLNPTHCANAESCEGVPLGSYEFVLADPPYREEEAAIYGTPLPDRRKVLAVLGERLRPGAYVVWLDEQVPRYQGGAVAGGSGHRCHHLSRSSR